MGIVLKASVFDYSEILPAIQLCKLWVKNKQKTQTKTKKPTEQRKTAP